MATKKKAATPIKSIPPALRPPVNKTHSVLNYVEAHPDAKPKEISEAILKEEGLEVSAAYVSTILHKAKKSHDEWAERQIEADKAKAAKIRAGLHSQNDISVDPRALEYAKAMGGIEEAKEALDRLKRVKDQLEDV